MYFCFLFYIAACPDASRACRVGQSFLATALARAPYRPFAAVARCIDIRHRMYRELINAIHRCRLRLMAWLDAGPQSTSFPSNKPCSVSPYVSGASYIRTPRCCRSGNSVCQCVDGDNDASPCGLPPGAGHQWPMYHLVRYVCHRQGGRDKTSRLHLWASRGECSTCHAICMSSAWAMTMRRSPKPAYN